MIPFYLQAYEGVDGGEEEEGGEGLETVMSRNILVNLPHKLSMLVNDCVSPPPQGYGYEEVNWAY